MELSVFEQAAQAYVQFGWMGLVGVLLTAVVGMYKSDSLQRMLPVQAQWQNLHPIARAAVVFLFAFLGVGLLAYAKTGIVLAAIGAGVQAALVAMGGKAVLDVVTAPSKPSAPVHVPESTTARGALATEKTHSVQTRLPPVNL